MIDIFDLNYMLSSEKLKQVEKIDKLKSKGALHGLSMYLGGMALALFKMRVNIFCFKDVKTAYVTGSLNQTKALLPIRSELAGELIGLTVAYTEEKISRKYPDFIAYLLSIFFLPCYFYRYFSCDSSYRRKAMRVCFDKYMLAYGLWLTNKICFKYFRPELIVFANDHCVWQRAILKECIKRGVRTAYVQHAMVSDAFPSLEFDYSFLDGTKAFRAYGEKSSGQAFILGATRYPHLQPKVKIRKNYLVLCFNTVDSWDFIQELVMQAKLLTERRVVVRPHPRDPRASQIKLLVEGVGIHFSDPSIESAVELFERSNCLLAGVSGVHLDAALAGCIPFTLKHWGDDYYGFIDAGLVTEISSIYEVDRFKSAKSLNEAVKSFDARSGTRGLPSVSKLIASVLSSSTLHQSFLCRKNGVYVYPDHFYNSD